MAQDGEKTEGVEKQEDDSDKGVRGRYEERAVRSGRGRRSH